MYMLKNSLVDNERTKIWARLSDMWKISEKYWYPLFSCDREDLIAFHSNGGNFIIESLKKEWNDWNKNLK